MTNSQRIILNIGRFKAFSLRSGNKTRIPHSPAVFIIIMEGYKEQFEKRKIADSKNGKEKNQNVHIDRCDFLHGKLLHLTAVRKEKLISKITG